ncbi:MAG: acetyl-CoA synthetase [Ruminococcaceae bacterium]|nr:acetyl-CoA synthetase [Oscillospiraceae bacterium]
MLVNRFCRTDFTSYEDFKKNFKIHIPEHFNFAYDVMDVLAEEKPDKGCLLWCDDQGREREITFGEMKLLSNKCANMLLGHGIQKGDFVIATLRSRYEFWIVAIACHKMGAVLVPVTHQSTLKDFQYRFTKASVKAIFAVHDERLLSCIQEAEETTGHRLQAKFVIDGESEGFLNFDQEMDLYSTELERIPNENSDPMLCYFTSGTSGYPKMALHNYAYPLGHIMTAKFWQTLGPDDLHFTSADTGWAKTSWGKLYGQWIAEAEIFVYDYGTRFIPTDLLKVISKYKVTVFCAPPTIFRFLIREDLTKYDLSSLRYTTIAGEPLNAEVYNKWKEMTGLELREGFGQTETPVIIATYPWIQPKPGSTGKFSPHFDIDLVKNDGTRCEVGEEGEICINIENGIPAGLISCYYLDEEKTAEATRGGWYHTGDMAWSDEDGYIHFVGRSDDVIKSSGYRIGPFEVESALMEHPAVLETAITAVPDPQRGQIVKATVVLTKAYRPEGLNKEDTAAYYEKLKKELQTHVKKTTAPYKYPRIVEFVDELPKTTSGKVRRVEIRNRDQNA